MAMFDGKSVSYSCGGRHGFWFRDPEEAAVMIWMLRRTARAMKGKGGHKRRCGSFPMRGFRALRYGLERFENPQNDPPVDEERGA
jgi:hypothetical protein